MSNISFAHIARLDWNLIPHSNMMVKYVGIVLIVAIVVVGGILGFKYLGTQNNDKEPMLITVDSMNIKTEEIKKEVQDSLHKEQAKKDSLDEVKRKNEAKRSAVAKKKAEQKKIEQRKAEEKKKAEQKKAEEKKKIEQEKSVRRIR